MTELMTETKKELIPQDCVFEKKIENNSINFIVILFKNILALILLPLYLILSLFENKTFSKVLKQIIFLLYFLFIFIFFYTLITLNNGIKNKEKVITEIKYRDKIRNIE